MSSYTLIGTTGTETVQQYSNGKCPHCGCFHESTCPRIKAIEYHKGGGIKRVEFHDVQTPATAIPPYTITIGGATGTATFGDISTGTQAWNDPNVLLSWTN